MSKQLKKKSATLLPIDRHYKSFLKDIKERLKTAQIRAAMAANSELVKFYWQLGKDIIEKQKAFSWGDNFLEQFSNDIKKMFPEMQGFSVRNIYRMKQFAQLYPDLLILPQPVANLPWGHISLLIH